MGRKHGALVDALKKEIDHTKRLVRHPLLQNQFIDHLTKGVRLLHIQKMFTFS